MITGIDHISLGVTGASEAAAGYAAILDREPRDGRLQLDNAALVFQPASRPDEASAGPALGLILATADVAATARRLSRRALPAIAGPIIDRYDIEPSATHGVPIGIVAAREMVSSDTTRDIVGLDHVVIRTPDPERAVALYGGRLGLDLRLDRSNAALGSRMLFFVCGGLVVEITHDLKREAGSSTDQIRGLAWRARDIERAHARMQASGVAVSELRAGRRPGTRVFTVKSHTAGVATLVIGGEGLERS